jgi:N-acetylmuramoyl-L-alanine amidase
MDAHPPHRRFALAVLVTIGVVVGGYLAATRISGSHAALAATRPSPAAPANAAKKSLAGKVIVIDPGHNVRNRLHPTEINRPVFFGIPGETKPCDTTGTATAAGYTEAQYNLSVGEHAVKILRDMGATVIMTPVNTRPWGPCITRRAAIGNINFANAAVSIHADGSPASVHGFYVIVPSAPLPGVGLGPKRIIRDEHLGAAMLKAYHRVTGMPISNLYTTGYLRSDAYGGTNLSHVPKIFIETGNMPNPGDAAKLESRAFRHLAALGIADGIRLYLTGHL